MVQYSSPHYNHTAPSVTHKAGQRRISRAMFGFLKVRRQKDQDIELGQTTNRRDFINGFPSVAELIASEPDHSFSMYPAFNRLAARNILYLEAELFELQRLQDEMDARDFRGFQGQPDPDTHQCFRSWRKMNSDPRQRQRIELIHKIRVVLKEYREALVLQEKVSRMEKPMPQTIEALKCWLNGQSEGPNGRSAPSFAPGSGATRLDDESDLVALHPAFEGDWLTKFVYLPYLRMLCLNFHVDESIAIFSKKKLDQAVAVLSIFVTAVLLVVSIVTLYFATTNNMRLGLLCLFTILFAVAVNTMSNAGRAELFASTSALVPF
ncbi:hypothetical protein G7Y89_g3322 [Cudoniella acicularis]|uniref:DUF6594 domain-containing protein n=1 Tax=Cudoniella acicularis TaxID=354080 RepID=A0A8H4W5B1_9HELO|nr:hypothetical protein G7Y89_g3322 [Cudoniella acicularis]